MAVSGDAGRVWRWRADGVRMPSGVVGAGDLSQIRTITGRGQSLPIYTRKYLYMRAYYMRVLYAGAPLPMRACVRGCGVTPPPREGVDKRG